MDALTKKDVVVVALASLDGATQSVDTEDVAIAAHALAPTAFGWRKHTEHIDLDVVRTSLRHEKESQDARIDGSVRAGWHLTPSGMQWLDVNPGLTNRASIAVADTPAATAKRRAETRDVSSAVDRVRSSTAYKAWASGREVSERAASEVFRIDEYTPTSDRTKKTARIKALAEGHDDIASFLAVAIPAALALRAPTAASEDRKDNTR